MVESVTNHMCTLITGTPTNFFNLWKYGISFQFSGKRSFRISTDWDK